jgi:hypothetical protein
VKFFKVMHSLAKRRRIGCGGAERASPAGPLSDERRRTLERAEIADAFALMHAT